MDEKGSYQHIALEKAAEAQEVIRVSAAGVETISGKQAAGVLRPTEDVAADSAEGLAGISADAPVQAVADKQSFEASSNQEKPSEVKVPFAGMQKVIVGVLVVALIAFIVYFVIAYG